MKKIILLTLLFHLTITLSATLRLTVASIPEDLRQDASSVVRAELIKYTVKPNGTAIETGMRAITILSPEGREAAAFACVSSKEQELKSFTADTYDRYAKKVRVENKKQMQSIVYLSSKTKVPTEQLYFLPTPASYPFSVVYHWEREIEQGTMGFPLLMPQKAFGQSVEYAEYIISVPQGYSTKRLPLRHEENYTFSASKKTDNHSFVMENIPALTEDPFSRRLIDVAPVIIINPKKFHYQKVEQEVASWDDFGGFSYCVLERMGTLSEEQKQQIKQLTDSAKNIEEKYYKLKEAISLPLSYTEWSNLRTPFPALPIQEWKNLEQADSRIMALYWWAVFKEAEIPADYVAVNSWQEHINEQAPNLHQFNHALLRIRLPKDTVWVDFSAPEYPQHYFKNIWRGYKWLAIGNDSTHQIITLPTLSDMNHLQTSHNSVYVETSGKATMKFVRTSYGMQYENEKKIMALTGKNREKAIASSLAIPATVRNVAMKESAHTPLPSITTKADMTNGIFATRIGNTLYMYPNILHLGFKLNKTRRNQGDDIAIHQGYCNKDTVDVYPPQGYYIDRIPQEKEYSASFGTFRFTFEPLPHQGVRLIYHLHMKQGVYPAELYREFVKFCRNLTDSYSDRIFMKKDE